MSNLEEQNEAQRAMLAAQREEIEALYDIFAAVKDASDARTNSSWIVGYVKGIEHTSLNALRRYAADIREGETPPDPPATPDPNACKCGHPGREHVYYSPSPCSQCDCKEFDAAVTPGEDAVAIIAEDAVAIIARAIKDGTPIVVEDDDAPDMSPYHARATDPWCASVRGDGDFAVICNSQPGHDGPVHVAWAADGGVVASWAVTVTMPAGAA